MPIDKQINSFFPSQLDTRLAKLLFTEIKQILKEHCF